MVKGMRDYTYQQYQNLGHLAEYLDTLAAYRPSWCGHPCPAGTFILLKNEGDYESSVREIRAELSTLGRVPIEAQIKEKARQGAEKARLAAEHPERYDCSGRRIRAKRMR